VIMAEADFSKPQLTDGYPEVLEEIRTNAEAQAALFDDVTPLNTPVGAKRWSTANVRWEKFDGSSWLELAAQYAINVQKLQGLQPGNADGNIPVSNGALNTNLNCELLNGQTITYFATAQGLTDLALKEQSDIDAVNARIDGVTTDVSGKVSKAGDTMTGALSIQGGGAIHFLQADGASGPWVSWDPPSAQIGFVNAAGTAWNLAVTDDGTVTARTDLIANRHYTAYGANGSGITGVYHSGGDIGTGWADWSGGAIAALQIDAASPTSAYWGMRWTRWGARHFAAIGAYDNNGGSPMIGFALGGQSLAWSFTEADINRGAGGYVWGSWNFDPNSKVNGSVCNWNTGVGEWGPMSPGGDWSARLDVPAPYVMCGLYCSYNNGDLTTAGTFLRGVQLRNY